MTRAYLVSAVDAVIGSIKGSLAQGEEVRLVGFGTFSVKQRNARTDRKPQTDKKIKIKAKRVPEFLAGKALKEAVM